MRSRWCFLEVHVPWGLTFSPTALQSQTGLQSTTKMRKQGVMPGFTRRWYVPLNVPEKPADVFCNFFTAGACHFKWLKYKGSSNFSKWWEGSECRYGLVSHGRGWVCQSLTKPHWWVPRKYEELEVVGMICEWKIFLIKKVEESRQPRFFFWDYLATQLYV